jgi:hypothetical protein
MVSRLVAVKSSSLRQRLDVVDHRPPKPVPFISSIPIVPARAPSGSYRIEIRPTLIAEDSANCNLLACKGMMDDGERKGHVTGRA